jgi:hypothetical protein
VNEKCPGSVRPTASAFQYIWIKDFCVRRLGLKASVAKPEPHHLGGAGAVT